MDPLTLILAILDKSLEIVKVVIESQTPAQRAEIWKRHLDQTEWIYKLLNKFSDNLEELIDPPKPKPATPTPTPKP